MTENGNGKKSVAGLAMFGGGGLTIGGAILWLFTTVNSQGDALSDLKAEVAALKAQNSAMVQRLDRIETKLDRALELNP